MKLHHAKSSLCVVNRILKGEFSASSSSQLQACNRLTRFFYRTEKGFAPTRREVHRFLSHVGEEHPSLKESKSYKANARICDIRNRILPSTEEELSNLKTEATELTQLSTKTLTRRGNARKEELSQKTFDHYIGACQEGNEEVFTLLGDLATSFYKKTSSEDRTPFMELCANGHIDLVKSCIQNFPQPILVEILTQKDKDGMTPFLVACAKGHYAIANEIIQMCPEIIVQKNNHGENAFFLACMNNHKQTFNFLLRTFGPLGLTVRTNAGKGLLEILCRNNQTSMLRAIIRSSNALMRNGLFTYEAFLYCCENNKREYARRIYFASLKTITDYETNSKNIYAELTNSGNTEALKFLAQLERKSITEIASTLFGGVNKTTILHLACENNNRKMISFFAESCKIKYFSILNYKGESPASLLVGRGLLLVDLFKDKALPQQKEVFFSKTWNNNTLAHAAILFENFEFLDFLLSSYPELLCQKNSEGLTFFQFGLSFSAHRQKLLDWFERSSLPNKLSLLEEVNNDGDNCLALLTKRKDKDAIRKLLALCVTEESKQSLIKHTNQFGCNSFSLAFENEDFLDIAKLFYSISGKTVFDSEHDYNLPFFLACSQNQTDIIYWIHSLFSDDLIYQINSEGYSPIHQFCIYGNVELLAWAHEIAKKSNHPRGTSVFLNLRDHENNSPLIFSMYAPTTQVAEYLVNNDPNISYAGCNSQSTITHIVCNRTVLSTEKIPTVEPPRKELLQLLYVKKPHIIKHQLKVKDVYGNTPFMSACKIPGTALPEYIHEIQKQNLHEKNKSHENAMHIACAANNLPLVKWLHSLDPSLLFDTKDHNSLSPFHLLEPSDENSHWLFEELKMPIDSLEKACVVMNHSNHISENRKNEMFFSSSMKHFLRAFSSRPQGHFTPKVQSFVSEIDSLKIVPYPYITESSKKLSGEELVKYYNATIQDVEMDDYQDRLQQILTSISTENFQKFMNLGIKDETQLHTFDAAENQKATDFSNITNLLANIEAEKPDNAIPRGKEPLYYEHLKRILKHLTLYLEKAPIEERLTYLKDLSFASGCNTNFSTMLHNIYSRISGDTEVADVTLSEDLPAKRFEQKLMAHIGEKIRAKTYNYLSYGGYPEDVHVLHLLARIFNEANIPHGLPSIIDMEFHETAAIFALWPRYFRDSLYAIDNESFQILKKAVLLYFYESPDLADPAYLIPELCSYIEQGVDPGNEEQGKFLNEFTAWVSEKNIPIFELLSYDFSDEGNESYGLNHLELSKHFTKLSFLAPRQAN